MPTLDRHEYSQHRSREWGDFVDPGAHEHYPPDLELEPTHLNIDLRIDIEKLQASGTVTTTVRARRAGPQQIALNALDFLDVDVGDPEGHDLSWRYDGKKLDITWAEPYESGEERQVSVSYRVGEPVDGLFFSKPDGAYPDRAWYAATDLETERARHWLPCVDLPNIRTTLDIHLRAEKRFTILANGYLVDEREHDDDTKTAHWRLDQRCPSYLICFAIGEFVCAEGGAFQQGDKEIELAYFCTSEHDEKMLLRTFGKTGAMLAWITEKLDMPFPFPKYYQFALPSMGGAMENISLVSWDDRVVMNEAMASEAAWLVDMVNLHEMAHSYFGNAVVVRDFAHAWLKESWATYMEQCWREDTVGQEEALYVFYDHAQAFFKEADEKYKRPIVTRTFKSSWQLYDCHLYQGGACRLHALRLELGDEIFWEAVRDYLRRYQGKVVETDDFRHVLEEHSGRSLGRFFDQWFRSRGYPDIEVSFEYDQKQRLGVFEIEQKQVDSEEDIPVFTLSTDLGWVLEGEEHRLPVTLDREKHVFAVSIEKEPEQVRFDPENKVLHKLSFNPGDPLLRRQLTDAGDVIGRILAADELVKTGKRANIEAVIDAYNRESFWGVRERIVKALAEAGTEAALEGLAQMVLEERDPVLLKEVFRAAGAYRDARIRDALAARLKDDLPPLAGAAAYQSMGAQRQDADWDLLVEGSQQDGHNGIAQSGAFRGIAGTRREDAVEVLLEGVGYGIHSNRVRPAIASALGDIGKGLEKARRERVRERLIDLLRDPWRQVRSSAAAGLVAMKAPEAVSELESFGRTLSKQSRVVLEKSIRKLREADKVDGSALKKQVEELREKIRKLEDRVQKLGAKVEIEESESAE